MRSIKKTGAITAKGKTAAPTPASLIGRAADFLPEPVRIQLAAGKSGHVRLFRANRQDRPPRFRVADIGRSASEVQVCFIRLERNFGTGARPRDLGAFHLERRDSVSDGSRKGDKGSSC